MNIADIPRNEELAFLKIRIYKKLRTYKTIA